VVAASCSALVADTAGALVVAKLTPVPAANTSAAADIAIAGDCFTSERRLGMVVSCLIDGTHLGTQGSNC
jgi:hypothetical protein